PLHGALPICGATRGTPQGAPGREPVDQVGQGPRTHAGVVQVDLVLRSERCPQGAPVVGQGAREHQEFGLSAWNSFIRKSLAAWMLARPVSGSRMWSFTWV